MKLLFCLLLTFSLLSVSGQAGINDTLRQQLVRDWQRAKEYTDEYLSAAPADKYGFRPIDSMRSFAEQMLAKSPDLQNKDSVVNYVNTSYDFAIQAIQNMDVNKLTEVVTWNLPGGKRSVTRLAWLLKAFEHQTHHRGQCTVYLRLMGIKPPAEKLF